MKSSPLRRVVAPLLASLLLTASYGGWSSPAAAQVAPAPPAPAPLPVPAPAPAPGPGPTPGPTPGEGTGRDVAIGIGVGVGVGLAWILLQRLNLVPTLPDLFGGPPSLPGLIPPPSSAPETNVTSNAPAPKRLNHRGGNNNGGHGGVRSGNFVPDEVVVELASSASPQAIDQIARRYRLTRLESQSLPLIGVTLYRLHIGGGRSVRSLVRALQKERIVASVQPNYLFGLQEQASAAETQGDAGQYVLDKLQIKQAHRIATGKGVLVAVIDSEIDGTQPDLNGTIAKSFDALGGEETPGPHGTAMAGAIAAHGKLLGIAPGAELLAARAFGDAAKGTSFAIAKSLQWAADNGARIVNMSFAGPADPIMLRMLAAAYDKDMVLVAAAGNAGPDSPPLYPAADPHVIAVTATDSNDGLFAMANRGAYIAIAAPGVEILAIGPGQTYDITTGTSVAAAHVSGVAALLLERNPSLKPKDIRAIIIATAKPLGSAAQHSEFGAGLVNAYRAVMQVNGKSAVDGVEAK